jgi:hypothetical protein
VRKPARLGERHDALSQFFELQKRKLTTQRVTNNFVWLPSRAPASLFEQLLQIGVQINGQRFHVLRILHRASSGTAAPVCGLPAIVPRLRDEG